MEENERLFGVIPIGKGLTLEALIGDLWDPTTDELFPPKKFFGLGWGVNLHAIGRKLNLL